MAGVDVAYFLVHMLGSGPDYAAREEVAAARFAAAASDAGVRRLIYLGGSVPTSAAPRTSTADIAPRRRCGSSARR